VILEFELRALHLLDRAGVPPTHQNKTTPPKSTKLQMDNVFDISQENKQTNKKIE
jgi:hypothetical protein